MYIASHYVEILAAFLFHFRTRRPFQLQWLRNEVVVQKEEENVLESFLKITADRRNVAGNYSCRVVSGMETILDLFVGTLTVYGMYSIAYLRGSIPSNFN